MKNLKELQEKYRKYSNGLGHIRWGGKSYYEINSDKPLSLNSYGGQKGFILNELEQVELFDCSQKISKKRKYFQDEDWSVETDDVTEHFWDEEEILAWWGLTLDQYYPHPYYPEKKIKAFEIVNNIPFFEEGKTYKLSCGEIRSDEGYIIYSEEQCLEYPEFFRPIYV